MPVLVGTSDISKLQFERVRKVLKWLKCLSIVEFGKLHTIWQKQAHREKENPTQAFPNQESTFKTFL